MSTLVDAHAHVFAPHSDAYPRTLHELHPADAAAYAEDLLREMEENGVAHAVIVPLSAHDHYAEEALRRHPGRFAVVGIQDPAAVPSVEEFRARADSVPLQGLRLFGLGDPAVADVEELAAFPLLAHLAEHGHKLWFYSDAGQLPLLERVLERLPGLIAVLNHLGFCPSELWVDEHQRPRITTPIPPPTLPAVLELARFPGVHVLFSGQYAFSAEPYPYTDLAPVGEALAAAYGPERLMWASDYPWIAREPGYAPLLSLVDAHLPHLTGSERAAISGGTALRLFDF